MNATKYPLHPGSLKVKHVNKLNAESFSSLMNTYGHQSNPATPHGSGLFGAKLIYRYC